MLGWLVGLIVALIVCIIIIIVLILLIRRRFVANQQVSASTTTATTRSTKTTTDVVVQKMPLQTERRSSYQNLFHRGSSTKSFFNWVDHPSLINDAVENGWSRFAFTSYAQTPPSVRPSLFASLRVHGDHYYHGRHSSSNNTNNNNGHNHVEESWEIGPGSVDFMQRLHFKTNGLSNHHGSSSMAKLAVRMALPLPGPPVVNSFPQDAYFEINLWSSSEDNNGSIKGVGEGEKTKLLLKQGYKSFSVSSSPINVGKRFHVSSSQGTHLLEELKFGGGVQRGGGGGGGVNMTVGLSVGGFMTSRIPGSYPGSIGFNSDGSVFLSGMKLVFESDKEDWAKTGKVIGCGFDPRKKKVYFTVNSELVHVIHCKSEDFGVPLYPIIATNIDITLLVNLGQSSFNYAPSNATRTPNPCFLGPIVKSSAAAALGYEDSRELFSMGRLDANWLSHSATTESTVSNNSDVYYNNIRNSMMEENEEDSEAEFIDIVLDNTGRKRRNAAKKCQGVDWAVPQRRS